MCISVSGKCVAKHGYRLKAEPVHHFWTKSMDGLNVAAAAGL